MQGIPSFLDWSFPTLFIGNPPWFLLDGSPLTTGGDDKQFFVS
jgi:hypothetical protein